MSNGLSKLSWLKRTDGHKFTGAEFRVLIALFNHSQPDGTRAFPGTELMAEETCYRKTGVSEAVKGLKERGWIHETYRGNGKSGKASCFDLVPDAPNPAYRCGGPRCATCSNDSARAETLDINGSGVAEPLEVNGSGFQINDSGFRSNGSGFLLNGSAVAETNRSLTDPGSDPGSDPVKTPDPEEVRYAPDHLGDHEDPFEGDPLTVGSSEEEEEAAEGLRPSGLNTLGSSTVAAAKAAWEEFDPYGSEADTLQSSIAGASPDEDPFASEPSAWALRQLALERAGEERLEKLQPATVGPIPGPWDN